MNILIWTQAEGKGPFQRQLPDGRIFSDLINAKPIFTFTFTNLRYIEQANEFTVDGNPMTAKQKAEVLAAITAVTPPIGWYKAVKGAEIQDAYSAAVNTITGAPVDAYALASWGKQEEQARAVLANPNAPTPLIEGMLTPRGKGETKAQLAQKIVQKADAYQLAYAPILGKLQAKLDALTTAATPAEVDAVVW